MNRQALARDQHVDDDDGDDDDNDDGGTELDV